jgi:alpha-glucosidase (family GH31 glycosyl hydrolase)
VQPISGETVWLGVLASAEVSNVALEVEFAGHTSTISASPQPIEGCTAANTAEPSEVGHLAEAQAAAVSSPGITELAWQVTLSDLIPGVDYRYRFIAETAGELVSTNWEQFNVAWWETAPLTALTLNRIGDNPNEPPTPQNIAWLRDENRIHKIRFALPLAPTEHVVGFGERYDAVDQRGLTPDNVVFEQYKGQGRQHRTYFPMPFAHVIGGDGWGFHVRTSRRVWFDVAATNPNELAITAETDPTGSLALDIFHGAAQQVLSAFLDDVGRAEVLPDWVHRLWASGNEWNTQALVMEQMDAHKEFDIPVGVVVIEAWSDEEGINIFRDAQYEIRADGSPHTAADFTYPADGAWPDPKAMIAELHERDIKLILWQIPLLKSAETFAIEQQPHGEQVIADGQALIRDGVAILEADGQPYHNRAWWFPQALMPDLSTQNGRDWWAERYRYLVRDLDIDGFKTDGGEHAWGADLRYNDGTRGDDGNNLNPLRYVQTYGDLLRSEGKAPVTFSRSGFTGSQAHGTFWAGDEDSTWEAFRCSIRAGITAAACGVVYWGWDLAGFSGPLPSPELYIRAAAASVFMPIMQYHSEFNHHQLPLRDRTPWNIAAQHDDPSVISDFRELAQLRERLIPYLAAAARQTIETDKPLLRALFFDWPNDPEVWNHPLQFLLGDSLLINPVTEPAAATWDTYLPDATWIDIHTGTSHCGNQTITTPVTQRSQIPIFCRQSAWFTLSPLLHA